MSEYIYGQNVVKAALESSYPLSLIKVLSDHYEIIKLAKSKNIPLKIVGKDELNKISPFHQGVVAEVDSFKTFNIEDVINQPQENNFQKSLFVILDGLEDPHNLGAILRTAEAAGVDGVIFPKNRSVKLNATVAKVSTGAIFYVKCYEVVNLVATIKKLKAKGYWIVGAEATEKSTDYTLLKYDMPTVLVIGSEGKGISRLVSEECDFLVKIPMKGKINSLNASVSAGILIYQIKKDQ